MCSPSSKSLVSSLAGTFDAELQVWRSLLLTSEAYPYVFVGTRHEKVWVAQSNREPRRLGGLGGQGRGVARIGSVEVTSAESEATYQELFRSLKRWGLCGVELVISDDHEGLKAVVTRHLQGASYQRCQVHYTKNLLGMVGAVERKELAADLQGIFRSRQKSGFEHRVFSSEKRRGKGCPKVAEHLEEHVE